MATLLNPFLRADDANGNSVSGGQLALFEAGTTTPVTTYSDRALTTAQAQPLIANAAGEFAQSFVETGIYKIRVSDADGATLYETDDVRIADRPDEPVFFDTITLLLASTDTYADGTLLLTVKEGARYTALASGATNFSDENAGGQKLMRGYRDYDTVSDFLNSVEPSRYTGAIWEGGGFRYEEVASGGDVQNAADVEFDVLPTENGTYPALAWGIAADGTTDDTTIMQAIAASGRSVSFPAKSILTNGVVEFDTADVRLHFEGTKFLIGDTGASGTTASGATGKVGYLLSGDNLKMTGSLEAIGQGTPGTTSLAGFVFDNIENADVSCHMRFETMAAGRFVFQCDNGKFGDISAENMYGLQTFESPPSNNAGSAEIVIGCQYSSFGVITSVDTEKPARYCSLDTAQRQTQDCVFGAISCQNRSASITGHALALRNALRCSFGPVSISGPTLGVFVVQYSGDTALCDQNSIDAINANITTSGFSVDAIFTQESGGNNIGTTSVGSINGAATGEFGIYVTSGTLQVGTAHLSGAATRLALVAGSAAGDSYLSFGSLNISGQTSSASPVSVGKGGRLHIGIITIANGPTPAVTAAVRYDNAFGSGSNHNGYYIGQIVYNQNGSANNYSYGFMDLSNGFEAGQIGDISGTAFGLSGARFASDSFYVKQGRYQSAAAPTSGDYTVSSVTYDVTPSAGGKIGWVCTTAGTPGTWKPFGAVHA